MRAQVGDEIVVESQSLGRAARRGRVQEILGSADTEHFRVRWDDGHESVYFPGADGHIVRPLAAVPTQAAGPAGESRQRSVADAVVGVDRIEGHATMRMAADALVRTPLGALVVQEPGAPPALLTQRDVLAALAAGADPDQVWAADVASSATVWVTRDEPLQRVADSMRDVGATHALVRDSSGLVGVAGIADVLAGLVDSREMSEQHS